MNLDELRTRHREMHRFIRANDLVAAEAIAVELAPEMERLFDELDDRGIILSWSCDR
jgi:hypothetical protein